MILISPPQTRHVETSIPKTRLKSLDQDPLLIFFSSFFFSSFSCFISARVLPGMTPRLSLEFGANTPQNLTRWRLGRGTREHSFSISSRGDRRTWVIPFFHAFLSSYLISPLGVRLIRSSVLWRKEDRRDGRPFDR